MAWRSIAGSYFQMNVESMVASLDRNRNEPLGGYAALASVLRPLQVQTHAGFGGDKWTADDTLRYLLRFTDP